MKIQQLFKSTQRKIDNLAETRLRLARCLREQRMGFKAANVMLDAVARQTSEANLILNAVSKGSAK